MQAKVDVVLMIWSNTTQTTPEFGLGSAVREKILAFVCPE
jgi:hypothetical protein